MITVKAEIRDPASKAKTLRRAGLVPCSIYGESGAPARLLQLTQADAARLRRSAGPGAKAALLLGGRARVVLLREAAADPVTGELLHLDFQALQEHTPVNSTVRIVLQHVEKQTASVTQTLFEVPYTALPEDIVDAVYVDVAALAAGTRLTLQELAPLQSGRLTLGAAPDTLVVRIGA